MISAQQLTLFILGCACLVVGAGLMVWASVQKQAAAGLSVKDVSALLKEIASVMDAIGRLIPNAAARVGFLLVLVGLGLIFVPLTMH